MRTSSLSKAFVVLGAIALITGCLTYATGAQEQLATKGTLVINLTSGKEDVHAVNMALELALHGLADGRHVLIFMNVRAPELACKDLSATWGLAGKTSVAEKLKRILGQGGVVLCCPSCMEIMGVTEAELADGVKLASKEALFGKLGADAVVFSY